MFEIVPIREDLLAGVRAAVEAVAAERRYLGRVTLPPFDLDHAFNRQHVENHWPCYVALDGDYVVGWADITPESVPECAHRGKLGMGVLASHRGKSIGAELLKACLRQAPRCGMSKVELTVYTNNTAAVALYSKLGFTEIGIVRDYRRLDGEIYDALLMERAVARLS